MCEYESTPWSLSLGHTNVVQGRQTW